MKNGDRQRPIQFPSQAGAGLSGPGAAPGLHPASLTHWPGLAAALLTARQGLEAAATEEEALRLALGAAARTLSAPYAAFWQLNRLSGKLCLAEWFQAAADPPLGNGQLAPLVHGIELPWAGLIDGTGGLQRATVALHREGPALSAWSRLAGALRCPLEPWVPVRLPDRGWGRLSLLRAEGHAWQPGEALFLEALARELGWTLADKRLASAQHRPAEAAAQAQAREQAHVTAVLQEALDSLDGSGDLDEFVPTAVGLVARALEPGAVALLQVREQRCRLQAAWLQGRVLRHAELLSAEPPLPALLRGMAEGFQLPDRLQGCAAPASSKSQLVDHADAAGPCPLERFFATEAGPLALQVPLAAAGHALGALCIYRRRERAYTPSEIRLAEAFGAQLSLALRAGQLAEQARRVATLEERTRLAREMHDTLAQGFTGVLMQLEVADAAVTAHRIDRARTAIATAMELARDSLGEARRAVRALRNPTLERRGLADALAELCAQLRGSTFLGVALEMAGTAPRLDRHAEEQVLRVAQEALVNVAKHAQARQARVVLGFGPQGLLLQVSDDGSGLPPNAAAAGFGLIGMRERALSIGATLEIDSVPGQGTTVSLRMGLGG
ncbi:sensor histidine kinase [Azohydromonas caseinilytica]|uniref:GAF domain-containing sensor histidine kinase n=1 Tax=Azohydromonas caseinilytica TaxID=2728836 RepID=A0A848FES9_9BURK|nr:sensor histidine kinase [Azohydromonas caseinilytica]NML17918.1 GAF domain-containing sensor histidine kinase [Azohydromonas caseinilytica]